MKIALAVFAIAGLGAVFWLYYRLIKHSYDGDGDKPEKGPF